MKLQAETFTARLMRARMLTSRVRELVFARTDGQSFCFQSGQWVQLQFPFNDVYGKPLRRSYSIASIPQPAPNAGTFELLVTLIDRGKGSTFLHEMAEGDLVQCKGPQGHFLRAVESPQPSLFIATGTGIAPFRGMIADSIRAGHTAPLWLLFGIRHEADALYREEFESLEKRYPFVRCALSLSRPQDGWSGLAGYVQTHVARQWKAFPSRETAHVYVCGVSKMLIEVRAICKSELQLPRERIHVESYG